MLARCIGVGCVAVLSVVLLSGSEANAQTYKWSATTALHTPRSGACAALLPDGSVLLSGGTGATGPMATAERFTGSESVDVAPMSHSRANHACVALNDGRVLVAGGVTSGDAATNAVELFDPATRSWALAGSMTSARSGATASLLADGRVLVAGGSVNGVSSNTLEVFNPNTNTFEPVFNVLSARRSDHAAAVLRDGRVLIAGGRDGQKALDTVDVFDPASNSIALLGKLSSPRVSLAATTLLDGRVYFAGGNDGNLDLASTDIFDAKEGVFRAAAPMSVPRSGHLAIRVPDNNSILLVGGTSNGEPTAQTELYIPWWNSYRALPSAAPAGDGTVTALKSKGAVMMTSSATTSVSQAALPTITTDKLDYPPGSQVTITGTNWKPNEVVTFNITRSPAPRTISPAPTTTADANGNFQFSPAELVMSAEDLKQTYTVIASGDQGSTAATITFTDDVIKTTTTLTAPAANSSIAANVSTNLSGTVTAAGTSDPAPEGTVALELHSGASCGGQATLSFTATLLASSGSNTSGFSGTFTSPAAAGPYSIWAQYHRPDNDVKWQNSNSCQAFTVTASQSIAMSVDPATGTYGGTVSLSAKLTSNGSGASGKTVSFTLINKPVGAVATDANGVAKLDVSLGTLSAGEYAGGVGASFADGNSTITGSGLLTISKKSASVTPNAASKIYGDADPSLTGTLSGFVAADNVTATYSRTAGETVASSPYKISATLSPAGVLANYDITYNTADLMISKRSASVTPNAASKAYGDADPVLTGTLSGFMAADNVTATYSRTAGETVASSPYKISATLSPAGVLGNYDITYNAADFTINKKTASVTPNAASKAYGDADPVLTGTLSGFVAADNVTATYSRTAGETVASSPYKISATLSPAGVLGNYDITYNTADFTINKKTASVTPNAASKVYGDADPVLTGTLSGFMAADNVTATYSRTTGETVANSPYKISATLSPAGVLANYDVTYNTADFTISKRSASVTPNAASKIYGDADPSLTGTLSGFVAADNVTATYSRTAGETAAGSPYKISATLGGQADVLANYEITYHTADLTISKRPASVTPHATGKIYGDGDPSLIGTLSGFVATDNVTATYSRTAGETVTGGPYTISATLEPAGVLGNYDIKYNTANFTITPKAASVTSNPATKIYGAPDSALTGTLYGFLAADNVTATYSRTAGETVAGGPYTISATLSPAGVLGNYNITYKIANLTITPKQASVTPNPANKIYGGQDPVLTGTLIGFLPTDNVKATYMRIAGEAVGSYLISAILSPADVLGNYNITYNTASFSITYAWTGFLQPIDNLPVINRVKAGSTVPVKWQLKDANGGYISDLKSFKSITVSKVSCTAGATDDIPEDAQATGGTALRYDPVANQFIYNWATSKTDTGCVVLTLTLADGSTPRASFQFK